MKYLVILIVIVNSLVSAENFATYPKVPKTASMNGFADPIYTKLPNCARSCVDNDIGNTPCPKWDTGCFCVMPQWSGEVGECFASKCSGSDISSATSLALSLCSKVGANNWLMPKQVSSQLESAASKSSKDEDNKSKIKSNSASLTSSNSKSKTTAIERSSTSATSRSSNIATRGHKDSSLLLYLYSLITLIYI